MNSIYISPVFKGQITNLDILSIECTLFIPLSIKKPEDSFIFFSAKGENFNFSFVLTGTDLVLTRNDNTVKFDFLELMVNPTNIVELKWSFNTLSIRINDKVTSKTTIPIEPPSSLKKWAIQENLICKIEYSSEDELREKVYTCLLSIEDKVKEHGINPFWDTNYNGSKIISRTPKKEIDVQPTIRLLLTDQMLQAGIELVPEFKTGIGNLDFAFIGFVKNEGQKIICAEFKNMHSLDIFNGLESQLPKYMRNKGAKYGAYCVLSYKGTWFDKPDEAKEGEIDMELIRKKIQSNDPLLNGIRVFLFDLSKSKTASINE